jgi:hypothetical protein
VGGEVEYEGPISPLRKNSTSISRRSSPATGVTRPPSTTRAADALSASTRGATSASSPISSHSSTTMSSSSAPNVGSCTPSSSCETREVSPTFRPHTTAPAATRRARLWLCTA